MSDVSTPENTTPNTFKAETRQLLNILIHSLYTEREIFLRELVSNASDALVRMNFELLTNRNVKDPELPLEIRISADPEKHTITIKDTGIGMNREELAKNLGTIAHSGAKEFISEVEENKRSLSEIIGQFGVGFYSAFMVAETMRVTSRSYRPEDEPASWISNGEETFVIEAATKEQRGTEIEIKLREDAYDFSEEHQLRQIIQKHSDFIGFPIYIGDNAEQVNHQTALWRQNAHDIKEEEYINFYKQFTLDVEAPLTYAHMSVDAPVQMYGLLFIPTTPDVFVYSPRREAGLKLYSHKILIQEYCHDLLPDYFGFIQGVIDSEDLPLNVSRETVQANRIMSQLKKLVTNKVMDMLKALIKDKPEVYIDFWKSYGLAIKEGIATEQLDVENLFPLLRFHTSTQPKDWSSLDEIVGRMKPGQDKLYYLLSEDAQSVSYSPHLDPYNKRGIEVIYLTDPIDSFMLLRLPQYKDFKLEDISSVKTELPKVEEINPSTEEPAPAVEGPQLNQWLQRFKEVLGEKVIDVRPTNRLSDSLARLVDAEGSPEQSLQRVYRYLNKELDAPKKVLEVNPRHPLMVLLSAYKPDDPTCTPIIEQIFENAKIMEGMHTNPAEMVNRIQDIMEKALKKD